MKMFSFGRNWQQFNAQYLTPERIQLVQKSLQSFLGVQDLSGKTFLDIGAGSGIVSVAAHRLKAKEVISFDYDPQSVACNQMMREKEGSPANWHVSEGSILDDAFVATLPKADIVYSWGVLHHTGNMWKAMENALSLVKPGGCAYIAIYNKADGFAFYPDGRFGPSSMWVIEKKIYSSLPWFVQNVIDFFLMGVLCILYVLTLRNPVTVIRGHKNHLSRGMSWRIDIKDWLGGYPYEYATVAEIFHFAKKRGFSLENLTCTNGLLNNEFLLRKSA